MRTFKGCVNLICLTRVCKLAICVWIEGLWLVVWQEDAIRSTRAVLEDEVDPAQLPRLKAVRTCHSSMKVSAGRRSRVLSHLSHLRNVVPHQLAAESWDCFSAPSSALANGQCAA